MSSEMTMKASQRMMVAKGSKMIWSHQGLKEEVELWLKRQESS